MVPFLIPLASCDGNRTGNTSAQFDYLDLTNTVAAIDETFGII